MKILPVLNNYSTKTPADSKSFNISYTAQPLDSELISFGSGHARLKNILSKLRRNIVIAEPVNHELFLSKLAEIKGEDCLQILSPVGNLIYKQSGNESFISKMVAQKLENNVVLVSAKNGVLLDNLVEFWANKATHVFSYHQELKKNQIFTLPAPGLLSINKARKVHSALKEKISDQRLDIAIDHKLYGVPLESSEAELSFQASLKKQGVVIAEIHSK